MKKVLKYGALLFMTVALMSCSFGLEADRSVTEGSGTENLNEFLGTVSMVLGQTGLSSSAAVPYWSMANKAIVSGEMNNYPEQGQITTWTVEPRADHVYRIDAITRYPYDANIVRTQEIYYLRSVSGVWDSNTQWVDQSGVVDPLYREKFETVFANGDVRAETITRVQNEVNGNRYESTVTYTQAPLNVDAANLKLSGTRTYVELGDVDETSRTTIAETGLATNLVLNGIQRGRTNITGQIFIEIKNGVRTAVTGSYRFVDQAGNLIALIEISSAGYTTTIY